MVGATRPGTTSASGSVVHNDGSKTVTVRVLVYGDGVTVSCVELASGESHHIVAPPKAAVEIHTDGESATAMAERMPMFLVRDGRLLVALE